jgi:hypothetical protein
MKEIKNRSFLGLIVILFIHEISNAQHTRGISAYTGLANNFGLNVYSESGYRSIMFHRQRLFPVLGLQFSKILKNSSINSFHIASHFTGHKIFLNREIFPSASSYNIKGKNYSVLIGFLREWPVMKSLLEGRNNSKNSSCIYVGAGVSINLGITNKFPFSADSATSINGSWYFAKSDFPKVPTNNRMLNGTLSLRYLHKAKTGKELLNLECQLLWAFSRTYKVRYHYEYEGINDNLIVVNRGLLLNLLLSKPLWQK